MGLDPSAFTSETQRGIFRSSLFRRQLTGVQASLAANSPSQKAAEFRQGLPALQTPNPAVERRAEFQQGIAGVQQELDGYNTDLRSRVGAFSLAGQPTEEERDTALQAAGKASMGAVNTVLNIIDWPRKMTFEKFVVPAAKKLGLVAPDAKVDPTGYDVFIKAMGGEGKQEILQQHLQAMGLDQLGNVPVLGGLLQNKEGASAALAQKVSGTAGLALDVLLDPLTWTTFGASGVLKAGGRTLTREGIALTGQLREGLALGGAAPELRSALTDVLPKVSSKLDLLSPVKLKEPEIDKAMELLRGTGVASDLFKRGGVQVSLPYNSFGLSIPLLNREQQVGLLLGGRELNPRALQVFEGVRHTALDLGEAALAKIPVPEFARKAGEQIKSWFVPYSFLEGYGRDAAKQAFKQFGNVGRAEARTAQQIVGGAFKGLTENEVERVHYWLDVGAQAGDIDPVTGNLVRAEYETFDEVALRSLERQGLTETLTPEQLGQRMTEEVEGLTQRLQAQKAGVARDIEDVKAGLAAIPGVKVRDLKGLRLDPGIVTEGETAGIEVLQNMFQRIDTSLNTQTVAKRLNAREVVREHEIAVARRKTGEDVPLTTLEQRETNENVRNALLSLFAQDSELALAYGGKGPMTALSEYAADFGQQTFLENHLHHMYDVDAQAVVKRLRGAPPQLGTRAPSEIGQQRVRSFLAEPEELLARGYVTNPETIITRKVAQYRTMSRESHMMRNMLENFGRKLQKGERPDHANEVLFNPKEWMTRRTKSPEDLTEELKLLHGADALGADEVDAILDMSFRLKPGEQWAVPVDMMQAFQASQTAVQNAGGMFVALDGLLAMQRSLVTSIWPAYHTRNLMGNAFNSWLGGVSLFDYKSANEGFRFVAGKLDDESTASIVDRIRRSQPTAGGPMALAGRAAGPASDDPAVLVEWLGRYMEERGILRGGLTSAELGGAGKAPGVLGAVAEGKFSPFRWGRTVAEMTDNSMRARHFFSRLRQGDTLEEATLSVRKFLFDMNDLTSFEKNVLRRSAFFYSWTRKNIPLQLEMLMHEPRKYQYWNAAFRAAGDRDAQADANAALMPAYIREQLGIVLGADENGKVSVLSGLGLPIEELNNISGGTPERIVQRFVGLTNPFIQGLAAAAGAPTGFTGRAVTDDAYSNYYRQLQPLYGDWLKEVPVLKDILQIEERKVVDSATGQEKSVYTADPKIIYGLYTMFSMGRTLRTIGEAGEVLREPSAEAAGKFLSKFFTGARINDADMSRSLEILSTSERSLAIDERTNAQLTVLAQRFADGNIKEASTWRDMRADLMAKRANQREELLTEQLKEQGVPLGSEGMEAVQKARSRFLPEGAKLLDLIRGLEPSGLNPLTEAPFASVREWAETRSAFLDRLAAEYPDTYAQMKKSEQLRLQKLSPEARRFEELYTEAKDLLDEYEQTPKYIGLSKTEARKVDEVRALQRSYAAKYPTAEAKRRAAQADPAGFRLSQRARPNTTARRRKWDELNRGSGDVLSLFFRDLPLEEASEFASPSPELPIS